MISLRQLRYLEAAARFAHFGKAASHCAVTQPALSMQIQELERELDLKLFERLSRSVALTEAGHEVLQRATRILGEVRDLGDMAATLGHPLVFPLKFGVIPTVAPYLLPGLLPRLARVHPGLRLQLREAHTAHLIEELLEGALDLLLIALPADHGEIETAPLGEDRFLLAVPRDRDIQGKKRATPDLLTSDQLLLLEEGHCLRDQALSFCELKRIDTIDTFGASSLSTIIQMVANGMGLTLLPEISIASETLPGRIRIMPFEAPEPSRMLGLAWRRTSPRKRDFAAFGKIVVEALPTLGPVRDTP